MVEVNSLPSSKRGQAVLGPSGIAAAEAMRPGFSMAELVLALTIGGVLAIILASVLFGAQRFARVHGELVAIAEARRVAAMILAAEIRYLEPQDDLSLPSRNSLVMRNYRGVAVVCNAAGEFVVVRYRGLRSPDPAKDSVVNANASGVATLFLSAPTVEGCQKHDGEELYRWGLTPVPTPGALLLLFESGSYHLADGALRYRRGESGRQPLTAEIFDDDSVGLSFVDSYGIELALRTMAAGKFASPVHRTTVRYLLGLVNGRGE